MREYISPSHYEQAERNGIPARNVYQRFMEYGWDIERAITEPLAVPDSEWAKWREKSVVSEATFNRRIRKFGMTPEEAASTPPMKPVDCKKRNYPTIPEEVYETALKIGVSRRAVFMRVNRYKWSYEDAMTIPTLPTGKVRVGHARKGWRVNV